MNVDELIKELKAGPRGPIAILIQSPFDQASMHLDFKMEVNDQKDFVSFRPVANDYADIVNAVPGEYEYIKTHLLTARGTETEDAHSHPGMSLVDQVLYELYVTDHKTTSDLKIAIIGKVLTAKSLTTPHKPVP